MFLFNKLLLCSLFLLLPLLGHADNTQRLEQQRTQFQLALKALQKKQLPDFRAHQSQLNHYALSHYLEYRYLRTYLGTVSEQRIAEFIKQNEHSFYADRLRNAWLDKLATNKQWSRYLKHFEMPQSTSRQCTRLTALIETGKQKQAMQDGQALWLVGQSQHKNCDKAFQFFEQRGYLTETLRWQRVFLALEKQQFALAKYLAKSVKNTASGKALVLRWQRMHRDPLTQLQLMPRTMTPSLPSFIDKAERDKDLIQYGLTRLARKSTEQAFQQWQRLKSDYAFNQTQQHAISAIIATRAALNRQDRTLYFYGDTPGEHWRARAALWQQDWPAVQEAIRSLNLEEQITTRWQYWLARSYEAQKQQDKADKIYQRLMLQRDYYGFLSADKLGKPYQMNQQSLAYDKTRLTAFSNRLEIRQLHEFYTLNMGIESRQQAYYLKQSLSKSDLEMLAMLAHQWGWYNQAIAFLGKAKSWNDLAIRFPIPYERDMIQASKNTGLNASWLLGIARQESAFNVRARSPVGARGLMQLMPQTARAIAKRIKSPLKNLSELVNPRRNIQLGSAYLKQVYDDNQKNPVLATASYNAGPHRVSRWLPKNDLPADIWIENIPFNETRRYTANVLSYAAIFDHQRQQKITPISNRMPIIHPKKP